MGRKKKVQLEEAQAPEKGKIFEYGDLAIMCKCGRIQVLKEGVQHGLQFTLVPKEESFIQLRCDDCGADLKLGFLEGKKPEEPVTDTPEANENIQEENKQE